MTRPRLARRDRFRNGLNGTGSSNRKSRAAFVETAMHNVTTKGSGAKLYVFELQDFTNGWTE
jgi:hypothetical protein